MGTWKVLLYRDLLFLGLLGHFYWLLMRTTVRRSRIEVESWSNSRSRMRCYVHVQSWTLRAARIIDEPPIVFSRLVRVSCLLVLITVTKVIWNGSSEQEYTIVLLVLHIISTTTCMVVPDWRLGGSELLNPHIFLACIYQSNLTGHLTQRAVMFPSPKKLKDFRILFILCITVRGRSDVFIQ